MDDGVGQVMSALKKTRADKNTFVFFTADNGYDPFIIFLFLCLHLAPPPPLSP